MEVYDRLTLPLASSALQSGMGNLCLSAEIKPFCPFFPGSLEAFRLKTYRRLDPNSVQNQPGGQVSGL